MPDTNLENWHKSTLFQLAPLGEYSLKVIRWLRPFDHGRQGACSELVWDQWSLLLRQSSWHKNGAGIVIASSTAPFQCHPIPGGVEDGRPPNI